jgi:LmbE family N-acetylglucosaminyl deacetylase
LHRLRLDPFERPLARVLCLGAHADDLEIGCSGTVMRWAAADPGLHVTWVVFSADEAREAEARVSADEVLRGVKQRAVVIRRFRDGFFPAQVGEIKEEFEALKRTVSPDVVLVPWRGDRHQDHRALGELAWQTFRDHLILEYEIPKYDGDLGHPNLFVCLEQAVVRRKVDNLVHSFPSQRHRSWFGADLFLAMMRLRGMEANAPSTYAEAFHCPKLTVG